MGRELQVVREREPGDLVELLRLDEQHAAILRIVDRVDLADAPRLAHVGAAGQHAAVEERLDAAEPQHVVVLVQRVRRGRRESRLRSGRRRLRVHAVGQERAARQRVLCEQRPYSSRPLSIGIGVDDAGDADGVVVGQHFAQPGEAVGGARRDPPARTGCIARSCAGSPSAGRSRRARRGRARRRAPRNVASMPLIDRASEFSEASGPVRKATGCPGAAGSSSARVGYRCSRRRVMKTWDRVIQRPGSVVLARSRRYARTSPMFSMSGTGCSNRTSTRSARGRGNRSGPAAPSCRRD